MTAGEPDGDDRARAAELVEKATSERLRRARAKQG